MILNTPLLFSINAFDPNYAHTFEFSYSGVQAVSNRAIITDNSTQVEVYNKNQVGMRLNHVLPPNTLEAGKSYLIQIQVYDSDGNFSNLSDPMLFYCFTTPQFYFSNINSGSVISEANLTLNLNYIQEEEESLNEYKYNVYNSIKELIYSSDSFYTDKDLCHTIYDLKNDSVYYICATGNTVHGIEVTTGMIEIIIKYNNVPSNILFQAINDRKTGGIILKTNIVSVDYEILNDNYTIEDSQVKLIDNVLTYKFDTVSDFSLVIRAKQLPLGKFCWSTDGSICISIEYIVNKYYCHLRVHNDCVIYDVFKLIIGACLVDSSGNIISDTNGKYISISVDYDPKLMVTFNLCRKNNIYDINATYT